MTTTTGGQLNQVDLSAVGALVEKIKQRPSAAQTTWSAEVRWTGAFRSEATVRTFAPTASDEPRGMGGTGITIRDLRLHPDGDLDLHALLGLADGHAGFSAIRVAVHLDTDAEEAAVADLHAKVAATSPVGQTLSKAIPVEIRPT